MGPKSNWARHARGAQCTKAAREIPVFSMVCVELGVGASARCSVPLAPQQQQNVELIGLDDAFQKACGGENALVFAPPWMLHPSFLRNCWQSSTMCPLSALAEPARTSTGNPPFAPNPSPSFSFSSLLQPNVRLQVAHLRL